MFPKKLRFFPAWISFGAAAFPELFLLCWGFLAVFVEFGLSVTPPFADSEEALEAVLDDADP